MARRLAVSEFPNDNPELHDGLVWVCPSPCAPALPTLRLRWAGNGATRVLRPVWEAPDESAPSQGPPAGLADDAAAEQPEPFVEASPEPAAPSEAPAAAAFESFVAALGAVLLERGATRAAATLGALFGDGRLTRGTFDPHTQKSLEERGVLDPSSGRLAASFTAIAAGWRGVLEGTSADLSGCGITTLDAWAAELLGALTGSSQESVAELRRALRQRGVAAFGILSAA